MSARIRSGGCLCGGVRYQLQGELRGVVNCFCGQCQKTSGNFFAATRASAAQFSLTRDDTLRWYRSSEIAKRGFCKTCGGNLFWQRMGETDISITAGSLDAPSGLRINKNVFVEDANDFHIVPDL